MRRTYYAIWNNYKEEWVTSTNYAGPTLYEDYDVACRKMGKGRSGHGKYFKRIITPENMYDLGIKVYTFSSRKRGEDWIPILEVRQVELVTLGGEDHDF